MRSVEYLFNGESSTILSLSDDPLMPEIAQELRMYPSRFRDTARMLTMKHANPAANSDAATKRKSSEEDSHDCGCGKRLKQDA